MCGPSQQEQTISDAQQQMYTTLNNNYSTAFGQDQAITGALTSAFQPILAAGPSQTGMSPSQENALRTQADEGVATNYAQAQKTTAQLAAAQGGGDTVIPSSTTTMAEDANANAAAAARSQGNLAITNENYDLGRQNYAGAVSALSGLSNTLNPNAYASSASTAGGDAATSANQIAQQSNSVWNAAIGALGSLGGSALSGGLSMLGSGGSSLPNGMGGTPNPQMAAWNSLNGINSPGAPAMYNPANFGVTAPPSLGY
jgi:hypothetical protein